MGFPLRVSASSSYKDTSHVGLGPTSVLSFNLNHLSEDPFSKHSYILVYWRLVLQHTNFAENIIQSITVL